MEWHNPQHQAPFVLLTAIEDVFLLGLGERRPNGIYLTAALRDVTAPETMRPAYRWTLEAGSWSLTVQPKPVGILRKQAGTIVSVSVQGSWNMEPVDFELLRMVDQASSGMLVAGLIEARDWMTLERLEEAFPELLDRNDVPETGCRTQGAEPMIRLESAIYDHIRPRLSAGVVGFAYPDAVTEFYDTDADEIRDAIDRLGLRGWYDRTDTFSDGRSVRVVSVLNAWVPVNSPAVTLDLKKPVIALRVEDLRKNVVSVMTGNEEFARVR